MRLAVAEDLRERGKAVAPVAAGEVFSIETESVVALAEYRDMQGTHEVYWAWTRPDGALYHRTAPMSVEIPSGHYAPSVSLYHQLPVAGEPPAQWPGDWRVELVLDDVTLAHKAFTLAMLDPKRPTPLVWQMTRDGFPDLRDYELYAYHLADCQGTPIVYQQLGHRPTGQVMIAGRPLLLQGQAAIRLSDAMGNEGACTPLGLDKLDNAIVWSAVPPLPAQIFARDDRHLVIVDVSDQLTERATRLALQQALVALDLAAQERVTLGLYDSRRRGEFRSESFDHPRLVEVVNLLEFKSAPPDVYRLVYTGLSGQPGTGHRLSVLLAPAWAERPITDKLSVGGLKQQLQDAKAQRIDWYLLGGDLTDCAKLDEHWAALDIPTGCQGLAPQQLPTLFGQAPLAHERPTPAGGNADYPKTFYQAND